MNHTSPALLLLALAVIFLVAFAAAAVAFALARWEGLSPPASLARAGVAFGTTITMCIAVAALLR